MWFYVLVRAVSLALGCLCVAFRGSSVVRLFVSLLSPSAIVVCIWRGFGSQGCQVGWLFVLFVLSCLLSCLSVLLMGFIWRLPTQEESNLLPNQP